MKELGHESVNNELAETEVFCKAGTSCQHQVQLGLVTNTIETKMQELIV